MLGDIVHNGLEVNRLEQLGLETIDYDDLRTLHNVRVLFRAHGEPPATYHIARNNNITVFDATCPVVKKLQQDIRCAYEQHPDAQIVIYGKPGHAEVIGLQGQTNNSAIIVESPDDLARIDFNKEIFLFAQTTMPEDGYQQLIDNIQQRSALTSNSASGSTSNSEAVQPPTASAVHPQRSTCRNVAHRIEHIRQFAEQQDLVIFVGGSKSSNAQVLFRQCLNANPNTIFISSPDELADKLSLIQQLIGPTSNSAALQHPTSQRSNIGITGATSTPLWLLQQTKDALMRLAN